MRALIEMGSPAGIGLPMIAVNYCAPKRPARHQLVCHCPLDHGISNMGEEMSAPHHRLLICETHFR
jgi:hypothetical protein